MFFSRGEAKRFALEMLRHSTESETVRIEDLLALLKQK